VLLPPNRYPLVILFAAFALGTVIEFGWLGWLKTPEQRLSDIFVAAQSKNLAADPAIVVVDIDEAGHPAIAWRKKRLSANPYIFLT
jgi:CHASE2 domain-containing sensor protein